MKQVGLSGSGEVKHALLAQRIEECALNAWPALQQMLYDGWVLRFAQGYTKRANSVSALYASHFDLSAKVAWCESAYEAVGLLPIFRLTPFSQPEGLDGVLAGRGYGVMDPTQVMLLDLGDQEPVGAPPGQWNDADLDTWMAAFCQMEGRDPSGQETHRRMLEAIVGQRLLALGCHEGRPVCCGLGVLEEGFFGLFDIVTSPAHRGQGHATALISAMLGWARDRGAQTAYLQVMESNLAARRLYARLGFQRLYGYWYRIMGK